MEIKAINNKLEKIEDSLKMKKKQKPTIFVHWPEDPPGTGRRGNHGKPEPFKEGLLLIRPGLGEPEVLKDIPGKNILINVVYTDTKKVEEDL